VRPERFVSQPPFFNQYLGLPQGIKDLSVEFFPVVEKTGGNLIASHELGWGADPAQQFFHNLTFEFDAESSSVLHFTRV
jgi:hypothetical protein